MALPTLDVVIVNWNAGHWLAEGLRALASAAAASTACTLSRVVIVDNASIDGSCDALDAAGLPLSIVRNTVNRGFAGGCNQGAAGSSADYLLFLNPDAVTTTEALDGVMGLLEARARESVQIAGVWTEGDNGPQSLWIGGFPTARTFILQAMGMKSAWVRTIAYTGPTEPAVSEPAPSGLASAAAPAAAATAARERASIESASPERASSPPPPADALGAVEVSTVVGAFFVIRRTLFEDLGGFDERFFMYFDEVDLCFRARQRGARAMMASHIRIYHYNGASSGRVPGKRLFYLLRSRLRYARAHFTVPEAATLALLMVTWEPLLRLGRAAVGRGPERLAEVIEAYARFAASLAGISPDEARARRSS